MNPVKIKNFVFPGFDCAGRQAEDRTFNQKALIRRF